MDPAQVIQDVAPELVRTVTRWYEVNHPKSRAVVGKLLSNMLLASRNRWERILPRRSW